MSKRIKVVALIAARNEGDIIAQVVQDLIEQGIDVYLLDDHSSDDTVSEASRWLGRGLIAVEQRQETSSFEWTEILQRKEELAMSLDADWFIHHDADEFRESPWPALGLLDAIREVDKLGYNAIDFRVLDFRVTHCEFVPKSDVRAAFPYTEPAARWDQMQIKAWKRGADRVELAASAGHEAVFPNRRVFPIQFLARHYPIRGQTHGERKVFVERKPRFRADELSRGWHIQYDAVAPHTTFLHNPATLIRYDSEPVKRQLQIAHRDSVLWAEAGVEAANLRRQLLEAATQIALLRGQIAEMEARYSKDLAAADAQAMLMRQRIAAVEMLVAEHRAVAEVMLEALRQEVAAQVDAVNSIRQTLDAERTTAAARHESDVRELHNVRAELLAVRGSWSWRITSPLRAVLNWLRPASDDLPHPK